MRKGKEKGRVLARVLAEELERVKGSGGDPVYTTETPRKDITDANNGDSPPSI
jgi:hypothetical protein